MDVTLKTNDLAKELAYLEKIVSQKPVVPILGNVLLQADAAGGLRLATTNLEVGLITSCQASVDMSGSLTLPVTKLLNIVRLLTEDVRLTLEQNQVRVRSGQYNARLQTLPAADFPSLPTMKGLVTLELPRLGLRDLIAKTRSAVSSKSTQMILNGALLIPSDTTLTMVATDGHRLAKASTPYTGGIGSPVIIPAGALEKLVDVLAEGAEATVAFAQSDRHLFFASDGRLLISRTMNGKFPAYEKMIPKKQTGTIGFNVAALSLALQRVGLMAGEIKSIVMSVEANQMTLTASSSTDGDAGEQIAVVYEGPAYKACVNGPYVLDFLSAAGADAVINVKDSIDPLLFECGLDYQYVVMPIRM
jgi:DNA polymerase III beta subunit